MKAILFRVHLYLGLAFAALWALQAATGVMLAFHWEIEDAALPHDTAPLDPEALGKRIESLQQERAPNQVSSIYASPGMGDQFDILISTAGGTDSVRVDGAGNVLRDLPLDYDWQRAGVLAFVVVLHQSLFADPYGRWLIGVSGLILLSNIIVGLTIAWPRRGTWLRALRPWTGAGRSAPRWHRALGLWIALPLMLSVATGALLAFQTPIRDALGARITAPTAPAALQGHASPADAIRAALAAFPGSKLAVIEMPSTEEPLYRVRLRQPGEWRRAYGTTTVFVDARDGSILAEHSAFDAPPALRIMDAAYPFHTGEALGWPGRILAFAAALCLAAMLVLGLTTWLTRLRRAKMPASTEPAP